MFVLLQCNFAVWLPTVSLFLLLKSILSLKKRYDQFCRWGQIWPLTYLVLWNLSAKDSLNSYIIPKNMEIFILFEYMCSFFFFFLLNIVSIRDDQNHRSLGSLLCFEHCLLTNQTHSYPLLRNAVGYGKTGLAS